MTSFCAVTLAHSRRDAANFLVEKKIVTGIGPMDMYDNTWELPFGFGEIPEGTAKLVCLGEAGFAALREVEEQELAKADTGARI
jgi:8-oxo-dGTP pyrophosphatase MutT (NUDIX family)